MEKGKGYGIGLWAVAAAAALCMSACGRNGGAGEPGREQTGRGEPGGGAGAEVWEGASAFVPDFLDLGAEKGEEISYSGMRLLGDQICFLSHSGEGDGVRSMCGYSLEDGSLNRTPLSWPEGMEADMLGNYTFGEDGSLYALVYEVPDGGNLDEVRQFVVKFDSRGNPEVSWEVTEQLLEENDGEHGTCLAADSQGRVCLAGHAMLWLYDADGTCRGSLDLGGGIRINALGCGGDGRMYVSCAPEGLGEACTLKRIDFQGRKLDDTAAGFPYSSGGILTPGPGGGLLVQDDKALYEYSLETRKAKAVLIWEDCGVGGSWVKSAGALADGRFLAVLDDWEGAGSGAAVLTEAGAEQIPGKETLVMGTLYIDYDSQDAVNRFNMDNDKYMIRIKEYADETALNLDIVSGKCPDIIEFGNLHIEYMIEKGLFEDLNPYLERSGKLSREDFFPGIMDAYVFDGIQVALPKGFELDTVIGKTEDVGSDIGWTLEEMMEFADAHPEAVLFDRSKSMVLRMMMTYNEELFVDWETGKCSFDSEEFRRLLEFVNSGPQQTSWDRGESYVAKIRDGEVLLLEMAMEIEEIQVLEEIFGGEVTFKGLPTPEGTSGATAGWSSAYAITAQSDHKDVAWEFLETFFTESSKYSGWFPAMKHVMEEGILQAMKIDHDGIEYGDHTGEIDGVPYTYRAATREEVDRILALIDGMEPLAAQCDTEIENIIVEEAESYFQGHKSVEDVMEVIQGRVQMYVNEKR